MCTACRCRGGPTAARGTCAGRRGAQSRRALSCRGRRGRGSRAAGVLCRCGRSGCGELVEAEELERSLVGVVVLVDVEDGEAALPQTTPTFQRVPHSAHLPAASSARPAAVLPSLAAGLLPVGADERPSESAVGVGGLDEGGSAARAHAATPLAGIRPYSRPGASDAFGFPSWRQRLQAAAGAGTASHSEGGTNYRPGGRQSQETARAPVPDDALGPHRMKMWTKRQCTARSGPPAASCVRACAGAPRSGFREAAQVGGPGSCIRRPRLAWRPPTDHLAPGACVRGPGFPAQAFARPPRSGARVVRTGGRDPPARGACVRVRPSPRWEPNSATADMPKGLCVRWFRLRARSVFACELSQR